MILWCVVQVGGYISGFEHNGNLKFNSSDTHEHKFLNCQLPQLSDFGNMCKVLYRRLKLALTVDKIESVFTEHV